MAPRFAQVGGGARPINESVTIAAFGSAFALHIPTMAKISQLNVYPIKSCAGIALDSAHLTAHGLEHDRDWMLVDPEGRFLTQRTLPRLALVTPELKGGELIVRAPGAAPLHTPIDPAELRQAPRREVTVWRSQLPALDAGDAAASWFSSFLGTPARLVRFDPEAERIASRDWTGEIVAPVRFADGFPLLVIGEASLEALNARLVAKGVDAIPMNRFRPNLVLSGTDAYEEDYFESLRTSGPGGAAELRFVKPCTRCPMPTIDQLTGAPDPRWPNEPTDTLLGYRGNSRMNGAVTFGENAIVIEGAGATLTIGDAADVELRFED